MTSWDHWSDPNYEPYLQLTFEAVDWSKARDASVFFGRTEREGLGGAVADEDTQTRGLLESFPHDPIHRTVGGLILTPGGATSGGMASPPTAGFDPIFCVHHSNIDRLWAEWSCMPSKSWGNFPPQSWFDDDEVWAFFDVNTVNGALSPVEVQRPRKDYFDYRALGISFKYEDLTKTPLKLPAVIPAPPSPPTPPTDGMRMLAKIAKPTQVFAGRTERIDTATSAKELSAPFLLAKNRAADAPAGKRIMMRISGVNLGLVNGTGFDVHLLAAGQRKTKRTDPSYVGSIALFRHEGHAGMGDEHGHGHDDGHAAPVSSDTFDITNAIRSSGDVDPSLMNVVIVPYSLLETVDGKRTVLETNTLSFEAIEFFELNTP